MLPTPAPRRRKTLHLHRSAVLAVAGLAVLLATAPGCRRAERPAAMPLSPACAEIPGCTAAQTSMTGPTETIWRVEVVRPPQGDPRFGRIEAVTVREEEGVPLGATAGPYLLAALDAGGTPLDGQYVRFPEALRMERDDDFGGPTLVSLDSRTVSVVGYVRAAAGATRVVLVDARDREVASAALPTKTADVRHPTASSVSRLARSLAPVVPVAAQERSSFSPPAHCAHVMLLEGEADRAWATGVDAQPTDLVIAGPTQRAVLQGALELMTPLLCHGISRVAFARLVGDEGTGGVVRQATAGDFVILNVDALEANGLDYREETLAASQEARLRLMKTILHEAAHAAEALLNVEGARPQNFKGGWRPESRALARETLDRVRLHKSLNIEWQRVHFAFERQDWALAYPSSYTTEAREGIRTRSAAEVTRGGVMSRYGAVWYADDIADMVAWTYLAPHFRAAGIPDGPRETEDYACQQMRAHGVREVPSRFAAVYTKLMFLKDLGLVSPDDVATCVGAVGLPVDAPGFHVWQGGAYRLSYDTGVTARIGTLRDRYVFELRGEGRAQFGDKTYPAKATLRLDLDPATTPLAEVAWPRGVYPLSWIREASGFELRLDGAAAGNFDVQEGFALVAEASNSRIAGSVFVRLAFRPQAPMPVPQVFDPPLVIRFVLEK